jgi:membrane protein DedA with SNARE-associated domain
VSIAQDIGYPALFGLIMAESGGVPVPGETALIAAGALAGQGRLDLALVVGLAATAAIVGDNIGYLVSRRGGRWLLERPGRFEGQRRRVLEYGEPFFERHGAKAVFFGRWILGLRVWASWLAGITRMPWRRFLLFNALGGITWAATIGTLAYVAGNGVEKLVRDFGFGALGALACVAGVVYVLRRRRARARG